MLTVEIPGRDTLKLEALALDFNGTLAQDGQLIEGVSERLVALSEELDIYVVTADTHGTACSQLEGLPCQLHQLANGPHDLMKAHFLEHPGASRTAAIGNGFNDGLMLERAALGIAVLQREGAAGITLARADVVCLHIHDALDLLLHPTRLIATLRR